MASVIVLMREDTGTMVSDAAKWRNKKKFQRENNESVKRDDETAKHGYKESDDEIQNDEYRGIPVHGKVAEPSFDLF